MLRACYIITLIMVLESSFNIVQAQTGVVKKGNTKQLFLQLDNDWFILHRQTDRYYSFGMDAGFNFIPKKHLNQNKEASNNYAKFHSINIHVKGFTPEIGGDGTPMKQKDMRAFAGYLLGEFKTTKSIKKSVLKYSLQLGVLGPASNVGNIQNWFHDRMGYQRVNGWDSQLDNRFISNAHAGFYSSLLSGKSSDVFFTFDAALGNMLTEAQSAVAFRLGKFNPLISSTSLGNSILSEKNECFLEFRVGTTVSAYDATLQSNDYYTYEKINNLRKFAELGWHMVIGSFAGSMRIHFEERWVHHEENHSYGSLSAFYAF